MSRRLVGILLLAGAVVLVPAAADACPVCYGDIDGPVARGINNGILAMLAVVGVVQVGFVTMFGGMWRRGKTTRERRESLKVIDGGMR